MRHHLYRALMASIAIAIGLTAASAAGTAQTFSSSGAVTTLYSRTNLVSDQSGQAKQTDPQLKNAWGIAFTPGSDFWVIANGTGLVVLYDGEGGCVGFYQCTAVQIPGPGKSPSAPTGIAWNSTQDFVIPGTNLPATFIFSTEDGTIAAWNAALSDPSKAVLVIDNSASGAVYKGLAIGSNATGNFIYATNFRSGQIDVFARDFMPARLNGAFARGAEMSLPGFAPFGIQNVSGDLFVTYALQDAQKHDDVPGPGLGEVKVFDTDGNLVRRLAIAGALNSPWGIALAPLGFGQFGGDVLIGNFGDGTINAYTLNGEFVGTLGNAGGTLVIDGLWALAFGGSAKSSPDVLYFTAGPNSENNGLFGAITAEYPRQP